MTTVSFPLKINLILVSRDFNYRAMLKQSRSIWIHFSHYPPLSLSLLSTNLAHGSAASLISGGSSLYGSAEERQANEVRRLKRELGDAREQVNSLSNQLSLHVSKRKLIY